MLEVVVAVAGQHGAQRRVHGAALKKAALECSETADMLYKAEENTDKEFFAENPLLTCNL